ncbi:hypothetical protein [Kitasatospora atroaurantiaca]|uniref:Uncharacterized protein n=1 Tax=Kitasatospora atroaurantiaca TaxID=285545 RepID=A0A561EN97_9ACTN|nr:hypothetical protein [Kitasatospora atroaurantiaca]TWE17085.1 hypothetical protein FB465_2090 [Kitasatospora atroaurantiaca]
MATKGNDRDRHAAFQRGYDRGKTNGEERARKDNAVASAHIALATELRIPCPEPAEPGRPKGASQLRPEPWIVRKNASGQPKGWEDGWLILNPNLQPGDHVWTDRAWVYRGELSRNAVYRWDRGEPVTEAQRLAVEETARFEAWLAEMREKAEQR